MSAASLSDPEILLLQDPSTRLGNLAAFLATLDRELTAAETSLPVAVIQLAHRGQASDEASLGLAAVVRAVGAARAARRPEALPAFRLDGDKFALLLTAMDAAGAREVAEEILAHPTLRDLPLSAGIGTVESGTVSLGALLLASDEALHEATDRSENRIVVRRADATPTTAVALTSRLARQLAATQRQLVAAHQLALSDPVTGLPNQRALQRFLEREFPRALRHGHPLALLLVDGDSLKTFNDRYGYGEGDDWIRSLGELLVRTTRGSDLTARWRSGDEFIIALPETNRAAAGRLAERIRAAVERLTDHLPAPATVSIGVAAFPEDATTIEELLACVEEANSRAKSLGKNRVAAPEMYEPDVV